MKKFLLCLPSLLFAMSACMKSPDLPVQQFLDPTDGKTVYVSGDGDDANLGTHYQLPVYSLTRAAVIAKSNASTQILIHGHLVYSSDNSGTPREAGILTALTDLTISGGWNSNFTAQDETTVLEENTNAAYGPVIRIAGCSGLVLTNFTVTGGCGNEDYYGGGIDIQATVRSAFYCRLVGNTAEYGGGLALRSCTSNLIAGVIDGNNFVRNYRSWGQGAGIYLIYSSFITVRAAVSNNDLSDAFGDYVETSGGGIYATYSGNITIEGTVAGNRADAGGGIYLDNCTYSTLAGNVSGNTATGYGGGIYADGNSNTFSCSVSGNTAAGYGGGVLVWGSYNLFTSNCVIQNNRCGAGYGGGGIYVDNGFYNTMYTNVCVYAPNYRGSGTGTEDDITPAGSITMQP